jgi:hypothetical protein
VIPGTALALGMAGWMDRASSAPQPHAVEARPVAVAKPDEAPAEVSPLHLDRLAAYTATATAPRLLARSPFEFARPHPAASPLARSPADAPSIAHTVAPPAGRGDPSPPALAGITEEGGPDGWVRTAVLIEPDGAIVFVQVGQAAGEGYRVSAIESDRIVLVHTLTGRTSNLVLK